MCQRLKACRKSDFADTEIWIEQEVSGFLDPYAREVFGEIQTGRLLEQFAKVEHKRAERILRLLSLLRQLPRVQRTQGVSGSPVVWVNAIS